MHAAVVYTRRTGSTYVAEWIQRGLGDVRGYLGSPFSLETARTGKVRREGQTLTVFDERYGDEVFYTDYALEDGVVRKIRVPAPPEGSDDELFARRITCLEAARAPFVFKLHPENLRERRREVMFFLERRVSAIYFCERRDALAQLFSAALAARTGVYHTTSPRFEPPPVPPFEIGEREVRDFLRDLADYRRLKAELAAKCARVFVFEDLDEALPPARDGMKRKMSSSARIGLLKNADQVRAWLGSYEESGIRKGVLPL